VWRKLIVVLFKEIRWHGRGGQGAWTASELLAKAAILEGKYIQSFPEFGPERMGAPMRSFTRISDHPINLHCSIYTPDIAVVLDPTLLKTVKVTEGLSEEGILIINSREDPDVLRNQLNFTGQEVWVIPATDIAVKLLGRPITNTAMLGAVTKASGIVDLQSLEKVIIDRFPKKIAERNIELVKMSYREARSG
jgi:2-oxoacid:acceptor oxidoreductase gamma subunit (pyruvate/2-ketoisovalerate family)